MADDSPAINSNNANSTSCLTLNCPAKINLALSVAPPRPDGMHPIASWMVALAFGDTLTIQNIDQSPAASNTQASWLTMSYANDAPVPSVIDWPLEKDLAFRAHQLLEKHTGRPLPATGALAKRIPTGAGLGGGSSDAAAMLAGLNALFALNLSRETLCKLSQNLGSDVTYLTAAMMGQPSAWVCGLGEIITSAPLAKKLHVVLIFPGVACPTGPVYKAFDQLCGQKKSSTGEPELSRVQALMNTSVPAALCELLFNDLAAPAMIVQPILRDMQQKAAAHIGRSVHVTGSGATLFTLADDAQHAAKLAKALSEHLGKPCLATHTI